MLLNLHPTLLQLGPLLSYPLVLLYHAPFLFHLPYIKGLKHKIQTFLYLAKPLPLPPPPPERRCPTLCLILGLFGVDVKVLAAPVPSINCIDMGRPIESIKGSYTHTVTTIKRDSIVLFDSFQGIHIPLKNDLSCTHRPSTLVIVYLSFSQTTKLPKELLQDKKYQLTTTQ